MPTVEHDPDPSLPYHKQLVKETVCYECGNTISRHFLVGTPSYTDRSPQRWVTYPDREDDEHYDGDSHIVCTPCCNEIVPEENQAYSASVTS